MVTGLPRTITVTSKEVEEALRESVSVIVQAAKQVLERTPPELSADIIDRGVIITGGGALLNGLDQLLAEELKVPVLVAENPMDCVAVGTGVMLDNMDRPCLRKENAGDTRRPVRRNICGDAIPFSRVEYAGK